MEDSSFIEALREFAETISKAQINSGHHPCVTPKSPETYKSIHVVIVSPHFDPVITFQTTSVQPADLQYRSRTTVLHHKLSVNPEHPLTLNYTA
jgi:hypothetical protein